MANLHMFESEILSSLSQSNLTTRTLLSFLDTLNVISRRRSSWSTMAPMYEAVTTTQRCLGPRLAGRSSYLQATSKLLPGPLQDTRQDWLPARISHGAGLACALAWACGVKLVRDVAMLAGLANEATLRGLQVLPRCSGHCIRSIGSIYQN
ncbi:hypothetical protein ABW21_db0201032 [Orbilia brochopaga]|nr:hypothetical protein ABW21_db0201032 [Drechslerella brochopaga]